MKNLFRLTKYLLFCLELEILGRLRFPLIVRWLRFRGRMQYRLQRHSRVMADRWLREALPDDTTPDDHQRLAKQLFVTAELKRYLNSLIMARDARDFESFLDIDGWSRLEEARKGGNGVVLLVSHLGFPRLLRWYLRTQEYPVYHLFTMRLPKSDSRSLKDRLSLWRRARFHVDDDELFGQEDLGVQYLKKAYDHLRKNGFVNIAGDGGAGEHRQPVEICGKKYAFPTGGITLGLLSRAVILPCFAGIDPTARFRIEVQEPLSCPQELSRSQQVSHLMQAYAERIEGFIRRHPTYMSPRGYRRKFALP